MSGFKLGLLVTAGVALASQLSKAETPSTPPPVTSGSAPVVGSITPGVAVANAQISPQDIQQDIIQGNPDALTKLRDPFQKPDFQIGGVPKSELERYPIEQFELLGVATGPKNVRAMLRGPDNKTYVVAVNAKIGTRGGIIRQITPQKLLVKEKILNIFGKEEEVEAVIKLKGIR